MGKQGLGVEGRGWLVKWIVAFVLAVAIIATPLMSSDAFGPLGDLFVRAASARYLFNIACVSTEAASFAAGEMTVSPRSKVAAASV